MFGIVDGPVPRVADKSIFPKFIEKDPAFELNDHQNTCAGTAEQPICYAACHVSITRPNPLQVALDHQQAYP